MNTQFIRVFVAAVLVPCAWAQTPAGTVSSKALTEPFLAPEALVKRASKFMDAGNYRYAVGDLNRALRADPTNAKALALRGTSWAKLQETDKALADLDHAIQISPADPDLYAARAEAREVAGKLTESKVDREAAERLRSGGNAISTATPEPPQMASAAPVAAGMTAGITAAIIEGDPIVSAPAVRSSNPPEPVPAERKQSQVTDVKQDVNQIEVKSPVTRHPTNPAGEQAAESAAAHNQRARMLIGQNKFAEAIAELNAAVSLEASGAIHYNTRGYAYLLMHDAKHALADLDQAIKLNPNYVNAYTNRSAARKLAGDSAGSAADAAKARELAAR